MSEFKTPDPTTSRPVSMAEFLESVPPGQERAVSDLAEWGTKQQASMLHRPDIRLFCSSDSCNGVRVFRPFGDAPRSFHANPANTYLYYQCSNCLKTSKQYAIQFKEDAQGSKSGMCVKFGERPEFGHPVPARLLDFLETEQDYLAKGRRCENEGLGVGAFAYYRQVLDNRKDHILDSVIRVTDRDPAAAEAVERIRAAKEAGTFADAARAAEDAVPASLMIKGHNPLTLLLSALGEGLHVDDDASYLELSHDMRVVLTELSDRLVVAMKDEKELVDAVARLLNRR